MKKLITLLLSLLTLVSYSQTELDMEVFKIINDYRVSNGLEKLIWSDEAFVATQKHNNYMVKADVLSHHQPIDIPNHKEIQDVGDRFTMDGIQYYSLGENAACVSYSDSLLPYIGQSIVNTWIKSDGHRKLLLHKSMRYGSVSTSLVSREKKYYSDVVGNCFVTFNAFR